MTSTPKYRIIRGVTLEGGYIQDLGATTMAVAVDRGRVYEFDDRCMGFFPGDAPLVIDADGLITRPKAAAGYGFLPDDGEVDRLAGLGVTIPAAA